jgi:hypothetical protein
LYLGLPSGVLYSSFPAKSCINMSHVLCMFRPSPFHSAKFDDPNNIWWKVCSTKLLIMPFSPSSFYMALSYMIIIFLIVAPNVKYCNIVHKYIYLNLTVICMCIHICRYITWLSQCAGYCSVCMFILCHEIAV